MLSFPEIEGKLENLIYEILIKIFAIALEFVKNMFVIKSIVFLVPLLLHHFCYAMPEVRAPIRYDGKINVPNAYHPTEIRFIKMNPLKFQLKIKDEFLTTPDCLSKLFRNVKKSDVTTSGTWLYKQDIQSPNLSIVILIKDLPNGHFDMLVNLESRQFISLNRSYRKKQKTKNSYSYIHEKIDLQKICTKEEIERFKPQKSPVSMYFIN